MLLNPNNIKVITEMTQACYTTVNSKKNILQKIRLRVCCFTKEGNCVPTHMKKSVQLIYVHFIYNNRHNTVL